MTAPDLTLQLDQALNRLSSGAAWDRVAPAVDDSLQPYLAAFAALKQAFDLEEARPEFRLALRARLVGQVEAAPQPRTISSALRRAAAFAAATLLLGSAASPALAAELFDHVKQTLGEPVANLLQEAIEQSSSFVQDHAHEYVPDEQVAGLSAVAGAGAPRSSENPMQPLVPVVGEVAAMAPPVSLNPNPPAPASVEPPADTRLALPSETIVYAPPAVAELPAEPAQSVRPAPPATVVSSAPANKDTPPTAVTNAAPASVPGGVALPSVAGAPAEDQPLSSDMALPPASPRRPADAGKPDSPATVEPVAAAAQSQSDMVPAPVVPPTSNNPGKSNEASPPKGPPAGTPGSANPRGNPAENSGKPANAALPPVTPSAGHPATPANRPSRGPANVPGVAATPASPNATIPAHPAAPGKEDSPGKAKDLPSSVPAHAAAAESPDEGPAANPAKAEGRPSEAPGHAASGGHAASSNASVEHPAHPAEAEHPEHPAHPAEAAHPEHPAHPSAEVHPSHPAEHAHAEGSANPEHLAETAAPSAHLPTLGDNPSEEHTPASPKTANAAAAEGKPSPQNAAPEVNPGAGAGKSGAKGAGK